MNICATAYGLRGCTRRSPLRLAGRIPPECGREAEGCGGRCLHRHTHGRVHLLAPLVAPVVETPVQLVDPGAGAAPPLRRRSGAPRLRRGRDRRSGSRRPLQFVTGGRAGDPGVAPPERFEECGMLAGVNEGGVGEVFFRKALTARDRAAEPAAPRRRRT